MLQETESYQSFEKSLEPQTDPKNNKCLLCVILTIHGIDMASGVVFILLGIIGSIYLVALGSTMLLSVVLGTFGLCTSIFKRNSLLFAGILALPIAIMEVVAAFHIILNKDDWMAKLKIHQDELHLSDTFIENVGKAAPVFFYVGLVLSLLEIIRMCMLWRLLKHVNKMNKSRRIHVGDLAHPLMGSEDESSASTRLPVDDESISCDWLYWSKGKSVSLGKSREQSQV